MNSTISQRLASWAHSLKAEDLPQSTIDKNRDILVDIVGLCISARNEDYVLAVKQASESGDQIIIGHQQKVSASSAALINGTASHGEDFDDTFEGGPVHSGVVLVPALIAAAQSYKLSNQQMMLGIAAGTELLCRLALTLPKGVHKAGFHPTAVLGAFAATLGIAVACKAEEKVTQDALGIVGSMASGIIEYLGDGSWTKRMHPGWAAQSALRAYAMAKAGFNGPKAVFEGKHGAFNAFAHPIEPQPNEIFDQLGKNWLMDTITFKPYPCGTMIQPYIDCAIKLKNRQVSLDGIEKIICKTAEGIVHRLWEPLELKRLPPNGYAAKFSTPFGIALGLVRGQATLKDYDNKSVEDEKLLSLSKKVDFEIDPNNPYPKAFTGHVKIVYQDGTSKEASQDFMRGGKTSPLSRQEIDDKFRANVAFGKCDQAEELLNICNTIGEMKGNSSLLTGFKL